MPVEVLQVAFVQGTVMKRHPLLLPFAIVLSGSGWFFIPLIASTLVVLGFMAKERWLLWEPFLELLFLWFLFFFLGIRRRDVGCQVEPRRNAQ